jgi:hypothetical protein
VSKIAAATNTNGVGVFMHNRKAADPKNLFSDLNKATSKLIIITHHKK